MISYLKTKETFVFLILREINGIRFKFKVMFKNGNPGKSVIQNLKIKTTNGISIRTKEQLYGLIYVVLFQSTTKAIVELLIPGER